MKTIKTRKTRRELFESFCDHDWVEQYRSPFVKDDYVWVIGRHKAIRSRYDVTQMDEFNFNANPAIDTLNLFGRSANGGFLLSRQSFGDFLKSLPTVPHYEVEYTEEKCEECDGSGTVEYTYKDSYLNFYSIEGECPICDGNGMIDVKTKRLVPGEFDFADDVFVGLRSSKIGLHSSKVTVFVKPEHLDAVYDVALTECSDIMVCPDSERHVKFVVGRYEIVVALCILCDELTVHYLDL